MSKELASIIIPTFGNPLYLQRCLDSVVRQTYQNIEIIIVDDNGIGNMNQLATAQVLSLYADNPKVKYFCHKVNKNGSAARNTGFRASTGRYITFLDDDDEYYPEYIERQVKVLSNLSGEYAISYTSFELFSEGKSIKKVHAQFEGHLLYEILMHSFEIPTSSMMFKREAVEEFGGFDEAFKRHQDWEFLARLASKYAIKCNDYCGYKRNLIFRNSTWDPQIYKEYRLFWLNKMQPYIQFLDIEKQKQVYMSNRMDVLFMYLKSGKIFGALKEWCEIHPGIFGVKYLSKRIYISFKKSIFL